MHFWIWSTIPFDIAMPKIVAIVSRYSAAKAGVRVDRKLRMRRMISGQGVPVIIGSSCHY